MLRVCDLCRGDPQKAFNLPFSLSVAHMPLFEKGICEPFDWLATCIIWGARIKDLEYIFVKIEHMGNSGKMDVKKLRKWWPEGKPLNSSLQALIKPLKGGLASVFCNWLPQGVERVDNIDDLYLRFGWDYYQGVEDMVWHWHGFPREKNLPCKYRPCGDILWSMEEAKASGTRLD